MPHYRVWSIEGTQNYWVWPHRMTKRKRLIALNVSSIGGDVTKLECVLDHQFAPPNGVIMTGRGETITVSKR
jgi:hypothetical protein